MYYMIKTTETYRVPTVADALRLREHLERTHAGELISFKYVLKQVKAKQEIVDEYQVVTATFQIDSEKEPEGVQIVSVKELTEGDF